MTGNFVPNKAVKGGPVVPPPGQRSSGRVPAGALPDGVAPPGQRKGKAQPGGYVEYTGPPQPRGDLGLIVVCAFVLGLQTAAFPLSTGGIVLGVCLVVFGGLGVTAWVRLWLLWRAAWKGTRVPWRQQLRAAWKGTRWAR